MGASRSGRDAGAALRPGSQSDFGALIQQELPTLRRVARRLSDCPEDAEDLVQETLTRACRGFGDFRGRHPRLWLLTILRNAHQSRTARVSLEVRLTDWELRAGAFDLADRADGPLEHVMSAELEPELETALRHLPRALRDVVCLIDVDGLSYREAATVLGIPIGTVMSRLHRGRRRLRSRLLDSNGSKGAMTARDSESR